MSRDHTELEPDVQDDQLGQAARVHQRAEDARLAPLVPGDAGDQHRPEPLAGDRDEEQQAGDQPEVPAVEEADVRLQPRDDEEERQQHGRDEVLEAARHVVAEIGSPGHHEPHHERAEDRGDAALHRDERGEQDADEDRGDPAARHLARLVVRAGDAVQERAREQRHRSAEGEDVAEHGQRTERRAGVVTAKAIASSPHAVTSSTAAADSASAPIGRESIRRSIRIRASTGNAVIDIATPRKSANPWKFAVDGASRWKSGSATAIPSPSGSMMLAFEIAAA